MVEPSPRVPARTGDRRLASQPGAQTPADLYYSVYSSDDYSSDDYSSDRDRYAAENLHRPDDRDPRRYAPAMSRVIARLIDTTLVFVPGMLAFAVFGSPIGGSTLAITNSSVTSTVLLVLLCGGYEIYLTRVWGATVGKWAMGIEIVQRRDGEPPSLGRALVRWLIVFLSCFKVPVLILLCASPWLDPARRRQGWHDKIAGTLVLQAAHQPEGVSSRSRD